MFALSECPEKIWASNFSNSSSIASSTGKYRSTTASISA